MTIKTNAQAELKDVQGINDVTLDVNFDPEFKDCVRFTILNELGHSTQAIIKYADLFSFMFILATPEQQRLMIPSTSEEVKAYDRQHRIELQQDMKKGEVVYANCRIHIPTILEEAKKTEPKDE